MEPLSSVHDRQDMTFGRVVMSIQSTFISTALQQINPFLTLIRKHTSQFSRRSIRQREEWFNDNQWNAEEKTNNSKRLSLLNDFLLLPPLLILDTAFREAQQCTTRIEVL